MKSKSWLIDYGSAIVVAKNKEEAETIGNDLIKKQEIRVTNIEEV